MNRKLRVNQDLNDEFPFSAAQLPQISLPKHILLPSSFINSSKTADLLFELFIFVFTLISNLCQFLHLYRAAWWYNYSAQTVHFYLIDKHLVIFIVTIISRRLIYLIIGSLIDAVTPDSHKEVVDKVVKHSYFVVIDLVFLYCNVKIFQKHSTMHIFYLLYPMILYLFIFRLKIDPFLKTNYNRDIKYLGGSDPIHNCLNNAFDIRLEVETLKNDFNSRFKQIIFTSVLNAYYATFIPICFVSKHLFYSNEKFWIIQHLLCTWISTFTVCASYCFSIRYCDVLHRSSMHLGKWIRLSPRASHPPPQVWSKTQTWPYGSYVKYSGEVYKSVGYCNASIPSDTGHYRFYILFKNPSVLYLILAILQVIVVISQLILISYTREYQYIISIGLLLITNYYTLFRLIRDYLIVRNIYKDQDKVKTS